MFFTRIRTSRVFRCLGIFFSFILTLPFCSFLPSNIVAADLAPNQEVEIRLPSISPDTASVDIKEFSEARPTVFLIRDIHSHYEAQRKISHILSQLVKERGLKIIATEGLEGRADFDIFRALPYAEIKRKILDANLSRGEISAVEYFGVLNPEPVRVEGVEESAVFYRHIREYAAVLGLEPEVKKRLGRMRRRIDSAKKRVWPQSLIRADALLEKIRANSNSSPDLFRQFCSFLAANGILPERSKYPNLTKIADVFEGGEKSKSPDAVAILSSMNTALFHEIEYAGIELKQILAQSGEARRLIDLDNTVSLIASTLENGLETSQMTEFRKYTREFDWTKEYEWLVRLRGALNYKNKLRPDDSAEDAVVLQEYVRRLGRFTDTAEQRDHIIADRTLRLAKQLKSHESMALVIGGFHADTVEDFLKKEKINCVTITPMVHTSDGRAIYNLRMMQSAQMLLHGHTVRDLNSGNFSAMLHARSIVSVGLVDSVRPIGPYLFSPDQSGFESARVVLANRSLLEELFFKPYSALANIEFSFEPERFQKDVARASAGRVFSAVAKNETVVLMSIGQFLHAMKVANGSDPAETVKNLAVILHFAASAPGSDIKPPSSKAGFGARRRHLDNASHAERMSEHPRLIDMIDEILRKAGLTNGNGSRLILIKELILEMAKVRSSVKANVRRVRAVRRVIKDHYGFKQDLMHGPFRTRIYYAMVEAYLRFEKNDSIRRQVAVEIADASNEYLKQFAEIMQRASLRYILSDIKGIKQDEHARLNLYIKAVEEIGMRIERKLPDEAKDEAVWIQIKEHFKDVIASSAHRDLAHAFFNAVKSRFVPLDELDFMEVSELANPTQEDEERNPPYISFSRQKGENLERFLWRILTQLRDENVMPEIEIEESVRLIARRLHHHFNRRLNGNEIKHIDMLKSGFFRHGSGFIVGRVKSGISDPEYVPLVLSLAHAKTASSKSRQIYVDKVFTRHSNISRLFSQTQSHFHVALDNHRGMAHFLKTIMPWKAYYALYRSTGYNNLAKSTLLVDLFTRMAETKRNFDFINFEFTEGNRGHVMYVVELPGTEAVIKIIRDEFTDERPETRDDVKRTYEFVRYVNRGGVLLDVQNFRNIRLPRNRFSPELVKELERGAKLSVEVTDEHVILKQFYTMRRVIPLDFFARQKLREMKDPDPAVAEKARDDLTQAMIQYGVATKKLADANIFSGDQLTFNFGLIAAGTPNQRVVLYDYDQIRKLTDLNFRLLPEARNDEEEFSGAHIESLTVMPEDIFPEQFRTIGGIPPETLALFEEEHEDLFSPGYYETTQDVINEFHPELKDEYPYTLLGKPKGFGVHAHEEMPLPLLAATQYFQKRFGVAASLNIHSRSRDFIRDALTKWPRSRLIEYRQSLLHKILRKIQEIQSAHWVFAGTKAKRLLEELQAVGDRDIIDALQSQVPNLLVVTNEEESIENILPAPLSSTVPLSRIWVVERNITAEQLKQKIKDRGFYGVPLRYLAEIDQLPPHFKEALSPKQREQLDEVGANLLELISNYLLANESIQQAA